VGTKVPNHGVTILWVLAAAGGIPGMFYRLGVQTTESGIRKWESHEPIKRGE
jgi:hypothetical protein